MPHDGSAGAYCAPLPRIPPPRLKVVVEHAGSLAGAVGGALVWLGLRQHQPVIFLAGAAALLCLLVSFFVRPRLDHLVLGISGVSRVAAGDELTLSVGVTTPPRRSLPSCRVWLIAEGLEVHSPDVGVVGLPAGTTRVVGFRANAPHRGLLGHVHVVVSTAAPFGLVRRSLIAELPLEVAVYPARRPVAGAIGWHDAGEEGALVPDRLGSQVYGVREYRPGDSARAVAWRATARRGRLMLVDHARVPRPAAAVLVSGPVPAEAAERWEQALARLTWIIVAQVEQGAAALLRTLTPAGPVDVYARRPEEVLDWAARVGMLAAPRPSDEAAFRAAASELRRGPDAGVVAVRHLTGDGELR